MGNQYHRELAIIYRTGLTLPSRHSGFEKRNYEVNCGTFHILEEFMDSEKLYEAVIRIEERIIAFTKRLEKVETWVEKHEESSKQKNWQLWFMFISAIVGGISGWIFAILRS